MLIGYIVEAILVMMYTIVWILHQGRTPEYDLSKSHRDARFRRIYTSFHGSASVFLTTALLFSTAVQIAGIITTIRAAAQVDGDWVEVMSSLDISLFTLLAVAALSIQISASQPRLRRRRIRILCNISATLLYWIQLGLCLSRTSPGAFIGTILGPGAVILNGTAEELLPQCVLLQGPILFTSAIILWTGGGVILTCWAISPFLSRSPSARDSLGPYSKVNETLKGYGLFVFAGVLTGLIAVFALYIAHRVTYQGFGKANNEGAWTFGQIIALFTWLPVIVEFGYIYQCEFCSAIGAISHSLN